MVALLFAGCSKEEDDANELEFVQIVVTSDDKNPPEGIVSLFYLGDKDLKDCPSLTPTSNSLVYAIRSDGESIFPVSGSRGDKLVHGIKETSSVCTFFWNNLRTIYGTPMPGDKYAVFIKLSVGKSARAYKVFTIDKNKRINVHLPSASEYSQCVNAEWNIIDYPGD